ncbi:hypothetical protein [Ciceribacter sp. L1K22]|uniref:hypothetical protein n=1 Tax=Ciceribacter sp. L1K22 TaxID=2820275 RepID=UPI001ABDFB51|nr:hypothetical protein [Ciceribacter sp. L1K22]MBO3760361.1 hypothetical protein [Ciceribacter sp. L1K22]
MTILVGWSPALDALNWDVPSLLCTVILSSRELGANRGGAMKEGEHMIFDLEERKEFYESKIAELEKEIQWLSAYDATGHHLSPDAGKWVEDSRYTLDQTQYILDKYRDMLARTNQRLLEG